MPTNPRPIAERFWEKVKKGEPSECWQWLPPSSHSGYGYLYMARSGGKRILAHRLSYQIHYGDIPDGMCVCHKCDNPSCVNPDHLFLGTRKDNMQDKVRKGRDYRAYGESNPNKKFTDEQIAQVYVFRQQGLSQRKIGEILGMTQEYVSQILNGKCRSKTTPNHSDNNE